MNLKQVNLILISFFMSTSTIESIAEVIKNKDYYLIGVAGIPGSGKSYFS